MIARKLVAVATAVLFVLAGPIGAEVRPNYTQASAFTGGLVSGRTTFGTAIDAASAIDLLKDAGCITFEGSTADGVELLVCGGDPATSDKTVTIPASTTTTLAGLAIAQAYTAAQWFATAIDAANGVALGETAGALTFEGATADGIETRITATDPTGSDVTVTLQNASGTVAYLTDVPTNLTTIEANTGTKTTTLAESGETYTNTGDADGSTITLLNDPTAGAYWNVAVTENQTVTVQPSAGETLRFGANTCTTLTSNAIGSTLTVRAASGGSGGVYMSLGAMGVWTCN